MGFSGGDFLWVFQVGFSGGVFVTQFVEGQTCLRVCPHVSAAVTRCRPPTFLADKSPPVPDGGVGVL